MLHVLYIISKDYGMLVNALLYNMYIKMHKFFNILQYSKLQQVQFAFFCSPCHFRLLHVLNQVLVHLS